MVCVGFVLRVLYLMLAHQYKIRLDNDHFQFGWEMGRIARALATGYGYADPFTGHTGPTTWNPPLYPLIIAGAFKLFGVYTKTSAFVILTINCIFSAFTAPAVYEIARRIFRAGTGTRARGESVALWSGWLWTLYPAAMQFAVHWVWDMSLTAFLLSWAVVLALRVRGVGASEPGSPQHQTAGRWLVFGLLWGLIALANSSLLLLLPACGIWMILPLLRAHPQRALRNAALAAAVCGLVMLPWIVRNERVFGRFIPLRATLGAELYESVLPANQGFPWGGTVPPVAVDPTYRRYKRLGELEFAREQGEAAQRIARRHPARTLGYVARRVYMFWFGVPHTDDLRPGARIDELVRDLNFDFVSIAAFLGLALAMRNRIPGSWLLFWAFLLLPAIYYAITVQARFRHPLEPLMTVLAVYLFQSAERGRAFSSPAIAS